MKKYLFLFLLVQGNIFSFSSLTDAEKWATHSQEWVDRDRYVDLYEKSQGWPLLRFLGFASPHQPFFSVLDDITAQQKQKGLYGRHLISLSFSPAEKIAVLSNVHGEFHSLVRIIRELNKQGVLTIDFKMSPAHFLIFDGNIIGDSPYNIQVLSLVIALMRANPSQVFYIRGMQEDKEFWVEQALGKQLSFLFPHTDAYRKRVREFFNTLPLGIYVKGSTINENPLRISYVGRDDDEFKHVACKTIKGKIEQICTLGDICYLPEVALSALVLGDDTSISWPSMKGLQWNKPTSTWHIASSAGRFYRQNYRFSNDAFALITLGRSLAESTIALSYSKRGSNKFKSAAPYNLVTGNKISS